MNIKIECGGHTYGAVPNHYEINVAKDGKHLFATHARSVPEKRELDELMKVFRVNYPEEEGYAITVTAEFKFAITMDEYQVGKRGW